MTTPEQLLADASWRRRHSIYTLWALFFGLGYVSLLYIGIRAKRGTWTLWGIVTAVLMFGSVIVLGSGPSSDPNAPATLSDNLATATWFGTWLISAMYVFRVRKEWLRWKAAAAGRPKWYQAHVSTMSEPPAAPAADLAGIGLDDPTSAYLAPAPASPPTASTPPRAASARRPLPPPPLSPPAGIDGRPLPPPPGAPPAAPPGTEHMAEPIDLNTATVDELASLPGVGVATAHRIVEERNRRGGFESVDEAAVAAKLRPHVRSRLQQAAVVTERQQPRRRGTAGRIVDI